MRDYRKLLYNILGQNMASSKIKTKEQQEIQIPIKKN
jgi:hypothetical protein